MTLIAGLSSATVDTLAADGRVVRIRSAVAADADELLALFHRGSPEALRMRFFAVPGNLLISAEVARETQAPSDTHRTLVAVVAGRIVGLASFERASPSATDADFAVYVDGDFRGHGIGTLLLEHLAAQARVRGVRDLSGQVLPENYRMLRVARTLSASEHLDMRELVVDVGLATLSDDAAQTAADERERVAERQSLRPLFAPRSVAVVGAGREPGGIGHETLRAIADGGFTGTLVAVNPHAGSIAGIAAVPSLCDVTGSIDLIVVAVPAAEVPGVMRDAAAAGARAAVILTAGFGEAGPHGRQLQTEVVDIAREHSIRLLGPNCLGLITTDSAVRLNASFAAASALPGGLAVASQSGAVGVAVLDHLARSRAGVSSFVSLGNKADISGNDLLAYWYDDPTTKAVALYLESFGNPRRFARLVRALSRRKPVLVVKSGRSQAGQRAGASHTAAAAAPDVAVESLLAQAGVIRADTLGEMLDTARMLVDQPLPPGERIAILGNAGGVNVLAADAAEGTGLQVPAISDALRDRLHAELPPGTAVDNPLDLGAGATPAAYRIALTTLLDSGEFDAAVVVVAATRANDVPAALAEVTGVLDAHPNLPAAGVVVGGPDVPRLGTAPQRPAYDLPERAIRALGHAARYAAWLREPIGAPVALPGMDVERARAEVAAALADGGGWQPTERTERILRSYGITVVAQEEVTGAAQAVAAADRLGYPVVAKAAVPDLVHKSDVGAVYLGLTDVAAVEHAYAAIAAALDTPAPQVLIQPMAVGGVELVAGIVHDPLFGSLVMLGLGGVNTDLLGDRSLRLTPMTNLDGARMWRSLRGARLLTGYRGRPGIDTAAVEDLVLRLGRLAEDIPQIAELDLNPVIAGPDGVLAVDAKLRLAAVGTEPEPFLRQLRQSN
jgi:acyl-CoA synthetase (NDP forming)/GNAT superfamily N-acetyltransferase